MTTNYSTALSHIILAGTGIYCLVASKKHPSPFPQCSFRLITLNSVIGVWRWGNPSYGNQADKLYRYTSLLQDLFVLPCIVTTVWLNYGYIWELAYAHTALSLLPLITFINHEYEDNELLDLAIGINCISLGVVSIMHQNYFGIAAAINYAFNHVFVKNDDETYFDVTSQDLYNYAMCFFAFFALKAVFD